MTIKINSFEYQCWHEVGHAVACLCTGGDVEIIEFIDDENNNGLARTSCIVTPENRRHVACGGFATEYALYKAGFLSSTPENDFVQVMFKNATFDRNSFFSKPSEYEFSKEEDSEFMHFAIDKVAPFIFRHPTQMLAIVNELKILKKISGTRVKELLYGT